MEKYTRKELLKQIKQRLSNGDYDEIHKYKSINTQDKIIVLGDKTLSDSEIYDYYLACVEHTESTYHQFLGTHTRQ